jgi:hypothetical protein
MSILVWLALRGHGHYRGPVLRLVTLRVGALMYVSVDVEVDPEDVLDQCSDQEVARLAAKRLKQLTADQQVLLERVFYEFARRGDAPQCLREYLYEVMGKTLP